MPIIPGLIIYTSTSQSQHVGHIVSHLVDARGRSLSISHLVGLRGWFSLGLNVLVCTTTQNGITMCVQSEISQSSFKFRLFCSFISQLIQQV